jgi:curved DNA-binding protein CbpA
MELDMEQTSFTDYYEILQLSPNADQETIERVFRILAKRYHPDNDQTGDAEKFRILVEAHEILSDVEKRAGFDVKYEKASALQWKVFDESSSSESVETDRRIQQGILSIMYIARRRDASNGGVGIYELERLLGCPEKHMEFHIWYLREKGWIERTDSGGFAITVSGVEAVIEKQLMLRKDRLLPEPEEYLKKADDLHERALLEDL